MTCIPEQVNSMQLEASLVINCKNISDDTGDLSADEHLVVPTPHSIM
jgi:hypothetical protein